MSTELIAISGLGVAIISVGAALAGLILNGQNNLRKEIGGLRAEINGLREETQVEFKTVREETQLEFKTVREEISGLREETQLEFKIVREEISGLRERMARVEGLLEGLREAITGRRVAEETGKYDPR